MAMLHNVIIIIITFHSPHVLSNDTHSMSYIFQHPGGVEVLLENAGLEATYAFEDVGHSLDARELLDQYYIAELHKVRVVYN